MALKIRCSECRKKVSIDEAFAGGMCRCPYCRALVHVAEASGKGAARARPGAPSARPAAPGARPTAPTSTASAPAPAHEHVPMAHPVKVQGIITIVLLVLLLGMVGAGVFITLMYVRGGDEIPDGPPPLPEDPCLIDPPTPAPKGPSIADVKITAGPVLYLLDGGSSMSNVFDASAEMIGESVKTLKEEWKFNFLLAGETQDQFLGPEYENSGDGGKVVLMAMLAGSLPSGASNLPRALTAALAKDPKTLVLVARKPVDDALHLAEKAKQQGTVIHTISVNGDAAANASMKKLAQSTGGQSCAVGQADL